MRKLQHFLTISVFLLLAVPGLRAQRLEREPYVDRHNGYQVLYPEDWLVTPVRAQEEKSLAVVGQIDGRDLATRVGNQSYNTTPRMRILKFEQPEAVTPGEETGGGLRDRVETASSRPTIGPFLEAEGISVLQFADPRDFKKLDEEKKKLGRDLEAKHEIFSYYNGYCTEVWDCWTFHLDDYDIVLAYGVPEEHFRKWKRVFYKSVRSFELIERVERATLTEGGGYDQLLRYHRDEVSRTPGWTLLETPSKRYIIKTSSDDGDFIEAVIERLEASRDLFESEFPPDQIMDAISVVRVCSTMDEFHQYGKTGGGVAGWFNYRTEELVIVDFKRFNRNITYGVMTHEAFHQYCHFLFHEAEANRWFDEGHGDYYGGFDFEGRRIEADAKSILSLGRLTEIRQMIRDNTYKPLAEHLQYTHGEWQNQGPTGTACYSQSWALVYFLRQGMEGKVTRKVWEPAYDQIVPIYVRTLKAETLKAYEDIREERKKRAKDEGQELEPDELEVSRDDVKDERKERIWEAAYNASWGEIDIDEFEERWKEYVIRYLD